MFMAQGTDKMRQVLQAGKILQCRTALWENGRELHCLNILIHPLSRKSKAIPVTGPGGL
jgi:hypothetical protein